MSKVTVVGAGNVGATCANVLAFNEVADEVVMLDVKEGVSEGKAMDMMQTAQLLGFDTTVVGCTNDYEKTANSDVVVITSGIPRKPGMTREELIGVNAGIVKSVAQNILKYSPNAILVVISNPMDTMTYLSLKSLGLPKNRIIGMGGALDSSRFKYFLSQALGCNANEVEGMVIGGHGDTTKMCIRDRRVLVPVWPARPEPPKWQGCLRLVRFVPLLHEIPEKPALPCGNSMKRPRTCTLPWRNTSAPSINSKTFLY